MKTAELAAYWFNDRWDVASFSQPRLWRTIPIADSRGVQTLWNRGREMRTIKGRARSEGRTTPAERPEGAGRRHGSAVIAPSVQGWVLPHLLAWVGSRGVDASPIHRLFGRTRLVDPNVRVPEAVTEKAWRLAATLTGDEALGIHLAESLPRGALDLIEYALRSSPSLGKGLDRLARYGRLLSDRVAARTHRKEQSLLFLVHDTAATPLYPARAEFALAVALKLARDCTGADITPLRVCFAHPAPDNTVGAPAVLPRACSLCGRLELDEPERSRCGTSHARRRCGTRGDYPPPAGERAGRSRPVAFRCHEHTRQTDGGRAPGAVGADA